MSASIAPASPGAQLVPGNLQPLFWPSLRPDHASAWHGHVSFAHWLMTEMHPDIVVELGTHNGVSFAAFCNAVSKAGLKTQCYAVDSWEGDHQAGHYGEEVFNDISRFAEKNFSDNAVILRSYFDDAATRFMPQSIDVLHIDGLHTYEAVSNDFHIWLPKLSKRGVILFHDTNVHSTDFGVWRLWAELSHKYPHFNFLHSAGLGVIAVGSEATPGLKHLCELDGTDLGTSVCKVFETASRTAQVAGSANRRIAAERYLYSIPRGRDNVALNCFTIQSSVEPGHEPTAFGAVDGVKTGRYGFHTAYEDQPWWIVDLGSNRNIDEVVVYNRLDADCKSRANSLGVALSNDGRDWRPAYLHTGVSFGGLDGEPLRIPLPRERARYVKLFLNEHQFLHLDQVEVYAPHTL